MNSFQHFFICAFGKGPSPPFTFTMHKHWY